ncbi:hypothetical protein OH76DRAFT_895210 [Lentinus brumalis]|uniref:Uncharacterized protein n=1 Tax=Lentinus brumalis TaxID=2498619 RepID=A0A371D179_9APHY|nr:hypothetical protein OH76DRAFT_895210 [Polyporus brumalis]
MSGPRRNAVTVNSKVRIVSSYPCLVPSSYRGMVIMDAVRAMQDRNRSVEEPVAAVQWVVTREKPYSGATETQDSPCCTYRCPEHPAETHKPSLRNEPVTTLAVCHRPSQGGTARRTPLIRSSHQEDAKDLVKSELLGNPAARARRISSTIEERLQHGG